MIIGGTGSVRSSFCLLFFFFLVHDVQAASLQQRMTQLLHDSYSDNAAISIIGQNEYQELHVNEMLSQLDCTQTAFGQWGLQQCTRPTVSVPEINAAQERVRLLLEQPELFNRIEHLLDEIKKGQQSLRIYYNEYSQLRSDAESLYYYYTPGSQFLNKSKRALDVSYLLSYSALIGNRTLFMATIELMTKFSMQGELELGQIAADMLDNPIRSNTPWAVKLQDEQLYKECLKNPKVRQTVYSQGSFGDRLRLISAGASDNYAPGLQKNVAFGIGFTGLFLRQVVCDVGYGVLACWGYDRIKFLWQIMTQLKHTTAALARIMRAVDRIADCISEYPELGQWEPLQPLVFLLQGTDYWPEKVQSLCDMLTQSTFDGDTSDYWYSRGRVLLAHKNMKEVRYDLGPLWKALAYLDAQMSIVRLYKRYQASVTPFCFVDLSGQIKPLIQLEDFWLPLTAGSSIIPNSISMGDNGFASKVVITGPNGGGKSTIMKSICWSVIFAQSWGIVPARSATISLFTGLKTSFNPTEDLERGLSTFMAEKARMSNIESFVNNKKKNDCILLALDEPYRGTVEIEAAERVSTFCQNIAYDDRVALLLATHLEAPIYLEEQTKLFANYQMEFAEKDNDIFRTFKLIPGAAQWWFNNPIKRKKIIESLGV